MIMRHKVVCYTYVKKAVQDQTYLSEPGIQYLATPRIELQTTNKDLCIIRYLLPVIILATFLHTHSIQQISLKGPL